MALANIQFEFDNQTAHYRGKVRDVYTIDNHYLAMVASDRISAFDVVLGEGIPYKGQVLNQTATFFLNATKDIVPNWLIATPDPNVAIGKMCTPFKVEMVIRGYLAGHAAREYALGKRLLCGVELPDGLKENDKLPTPIITPTTKASEGHDEDISREEIIAKGIVVVDDYLKLEEYTRSLFERGTQMAKERNLILVDTKYEFGKDHNGQIVLIDEIHTPDSSRYFYADGYDERQAANEPQQQLSKEFVRQWLIKNNFQGKEGQRVPVLPPEFVAEVSERYIQLYEQITGLSFVKQDYSNAAERIIENVENFFTALKSGTKS
jgi:phosphoribosylaminoimidazole-succinocarboxamide synthase